MKTLSLNLLVVASICLLLFGSCKKKDSFKITTLIGQWVKDEQSANINHRTLFFTNTPDSTVSIIDNNTKTRYQTIIIGKFTTINNKLIITATEKQEGYFESDLSISPYTDKIYEDATYSISGTKLIISYIDRSSGNETSIQEIYNAMLPD